MADRNSIADAITPKQLAAQCRWSLGKAEHVLEALAERKLAVRLGDDRYIINGEGLAAGERMGVTKPCNPISGYDDSKVRAVQKTMDGGLHPFIKD